MKHEYWSCMFKFGQKELTRIFSNTSAVLPRNFSILPWSAVDNCTRLEEIFMCKSATSLCFFVIRSVREAASFRCALYSVRNCSSVSKKSLTSRTVAFKYISSVVLPRLRTSPPNRSIFFLGLAQRSWSYSRKTFKCWSLRKIGWAAKRDKNTSCIATVFLNVAKYSLEPNINTH